MIATVDLDERLRRRAGVVPLNHQTYLVKRQIVWKHVTHGLVSCLDAGPNFLWCPYLGAGASCYWLQKHTSEAPSLQQHPAETVSTAVHRAPHTLLICYTPVHGT